MHDNYYDSPQHDRDLDNAYYEKEEANMENTILRDPEGNGICSYITIYKPISGWKVVIYWWNDQDYPEEGGFYEPWITGAFAHSTKDAAIDEALRWARDEELPYFPSNEPDPEDIE